MYSMLLLMVGALFWDLAERTDFESGMLAAKKSPYMTNTIYLLHCSQLLVIEELSL